MKMPQFEGGNVRVFNEKFTLSQLRSIDYRSRIGLYVSKLLLFVGLMLIILENADYINGGPSYYPQYSNATAAVFVIGLILSFVSIPYLYYSSFEKFKKNDDFWDQEMFWILPLFFFATFFQYGSGVYFMFVSLVMSIFLIFIIHARFMMLSQKIANKQGDYEKREQYFESMKYLTAYYFLLALLYVFTNPIQTFHSWMQIVMR